MDEEKPRRFLVAIAGADETYASCVVGSPPARTFRRRYKSAPAIREVDGEEMQRMMNNFLERRQQEKAAS
jgi:hypothetical protein